ncbi:hypothetical protein QCN29_18730 [Streptomyces sp. HNM0663]|uniref:Uncharacterized protein n=1 Tax=Streptomyces chengmaiensis TaxID=3040919 RepID=A0ABT6HPZ3_9ACTN|nr:hypothetical protein [Streptomyces chengmaiensis]MDH2390788.1 hypothetical protein [Streptomyces chengmaiensis]
MMSGFAPSAAAAQEAGSGSVEHDWRFAELVARSCLQPELALRYALEPRNVLAEFGLTTGPESPIPALPTGADAEVCIINLSSSATDLSYDETGGTQPCICGTRAALTPEPAGRPVRQGAAAPLRV